MVPIVTVSTTLVLVCMPSEVLRIAMDVLFGLEFLVAQIWVPEYAYWVDPLYHEGPRGHLGHNPFDIWAEPALDLGIGRIWPGLKVGAPLAEPISLRYTIFQLSLVTTLMDCP